jgi:hypothetical protein
MSGQFRYFISISSIGFEYNIYLIGPNISKQNTNSCTREVSCHVQIFDNQWILSKFAEIIFSKIKFNRCRAIRAIP